MSNSFQKRLIALLIGAFWIYSAVVCVAGLETLLVVFTPTEPDVPQENSAAIESLLDTIGAFLFVSLFTIPAIITYLICGEFISERRWKYVSFCLTASPLLLGGVYVLM